MRPESRVARWLSRQSIPSFRKTLMAALIAVVIGVWSIPGQWAFSGSPTPLRRSLSEGTPWQLALQLQGERRTEPPWQQRLDGWLSQHYANATYKGAIFTSETSGDYLLWSLPESAPVFMYTHVHLISVEHWAQVATVRFGAKDWRKVLDHQKINLLVVEAELNPRLRALLYQNKEWQVILDETGSSKHDSRCRLLLAVRKQPLRG
jgi:hypothetical protein